MNQSNLIDQEDFGQKGIIKHITESTIVVNLIFVVISRSSN